jgi:hypothetical protein
MSLRSVSRSSVLLAVVACVSTSILAGCGSYRVVRKTPNGGEVALEQSGTREQSHEKAVAYIASQCPNGYDIVEEGEAVIGSDTAAQSVDGRDMFGRPTNQSASTTTEKREWRIKYQCKTPASAAAGADGKPAARGPVQEVIVTF